ncbi:NAD-dependent DNA ligase LigA [bacterium]|nr:NAD-dependent DNA ligase LigA [bacterium]
MTIDKSDVIEMEQKLNRWEYEYRVLDRPTVSDQYYDEQMNLYKKMIEEHPEYKTEDSPLNKIGTVLTDGFKKEKHNFIMGSLENTYSLDELEKWIDSVIAEYGKVRFSVEDKFDGISLSLRFKDGKLDKAVTRGNGDYGDNVTENAKMIWNMPNTLYHLDGSLFNGEIRGEAIILKSDVERINKLEKADFKNPRNLVSGTMKSLDSNIVRKRFVHFIPYYFYYADNKEIETSIIIEDLKSQFTINHTFHWQTTFESDKKEDILNLLKDYSTEEYYVNEILSRKSFNYYKNRDYPVDGAVIKVIGSDIRKKLGYTSSCPKWAKAFKYEQEKAITTVKEITWQVGRDRITPVAELEPVELEGTTVSRATVHNITQLKNLGIVKGSKVKIEKAGFIIPYIIEVVENKGNVIIPTTCPVCGEYTEIVSVEAEYLVCCNPYCKGKLLQNCLYSLKVLEIDNIGESLIKSLIDKELIHTPLDILKLKYEDFETIERMGKTSINKILRNIMKAQIQPLSKMIEFLGIKNVGKQMSEKIASSGLIKCFEDFINMDYRKLLNVNGIGNSLVDELNNYRVLNGKYLDEVREYFIEKETNISDRLNGMKFVVTGEASVSRNEIEKLIKDNGGSVSGSVSKNTDIVIIGSKESENYNSTKKKKAVELGKQIVNEFWLFEKLGIDDKKENISEKENNKDDIEELF